MDTAHLALDLDRFRKLLTRAQSSLHGGGGDPERDTARRMAEDMAQAAGLSFEAAVRMADGPSKSDGTFDFGRMWEAWQAAKRTKDAEAARHSFPETDAERVLRAAAAPFDIEGRGAHLHTVGRKALRAIKDAIPWPAAVSDAVMEVQSWDALEEDRRIRWDQYRLGDAAMLRRGLVMRHALESQAKSVRDATVRARWILEYNTLDALDQVIGLEVVLADFERMGERVGILTRENHALRVKRAASEGHPDRRTNAAKRAAVETVLRQNGADKLSLRQIADAAGVSHETARKVRASWTLSKIDGDAVRRD